MNFSKINFDLFLSQKKKKIYVKREKSTRADIVLQNTEQMREMKNLLKESIN